MSVQKEKIWEDVWINTVCGICYCGCGIKVRRINGLPVKIEGIPESSMSGENGGICGKGIAGLMYCYDPNRLKKPLRRTNPEKGIGVDPKWKEISWEEALSEITERMKKIIADDPRKIMITAPTQRGSDGTWNWPLLWSSAFGQKGQGSLNAGGGSLHCGNAAHMMAGLVHGAWDVTPDWKYTKYVIKFGTSLGTGSGHSAMAVARLRSKAIERGAREVAFDPICNLAGGKATEWIPIFPGTDSAVALAMCNYILNELKVYDALYLKAKTNLPYLIGADGHYIRDRESGKPLIFDEREKKIKVFDDPTLRNDDCALEGEYEVYGHQCRPALMALKEHLKQYEIEWAAKISTVPAATIKRLATEWVENAQIGSTIEIEGKVFPYRPVAACIFRGGQGHSNGIHQVAAADLLCELVGAEDVPGGTLGWPSKRRRYPGGKYEMLSRKGPDGVLIPGVFYAHTPWPPHKPEIPCKSAGCVEFWVHVTAPHIAFVKEREEIWRKLGMKARPEMIIGPAVNFVISNCDWQSMVDFCKDVFVVQMNLWSSETDEAVTDILLPDVSYLERYGWQSELDAYFFSQIPSYEPWYVHMQKPVAKPVGESRYYFDVFVELAERVGFRDNFNQVVNVYFGITDEELKLKPGEKLTWSEIGDRVLKWVYGKDAEKVKEKGYATWHKPIEDVYWRWEMDTRVPVYMEHLVEAREEMEKICKKVGLDFDVKQYTPLASWFYPTSHTELDDEYDLLGFSYNNILQTSNTTAQNPLICEISELCPYDFTVTMNPEVAKRKGLKDGDVIQMENRYGVKEKGVLKCMEGINPRTIGVCGQGGLWAKGRPIARGKGSNICKLLPTYLRHYDPIAGNIETSVALKVYKAE